MQEPPAARISFQEISDFSTAMIAVPDNTGVPGRCAVMKIRLWSSASEIMAAAFLKEQSWPISFPSTSMWHTMFSETRKNSLPSTISWTKPFLSAGCPKQQIPWSFTASYGKPITSLWNGLTALSFVMTMNRKDGIYSGDWITIIRPGGISISAATGKHPVYPISEQTKKSIRRTRSWEPPWTEPPLWSMSCSVNPFHIRRCAGKNLMTCIGSPKYPPQTIFWWKYASS